MSSIDPNLGLHYGWTLGESGWDAGMDANLKRLGAVLGLSVTDRNLTAPPANPAHGDRYLIPLAATGDWAGKTHQIAVRLNDVWEYYLPKVGWLAYIEDEAVLCAYTSGGWSAGIAV